MTKDPLIRDNPTIKNLLQDIQDLNSIKDFMPIAGPLLKLLGTDIDGIDKILAKANELDSSVKELASIPDRFNDLFSPRGWIIYELMNLEIAKTAIDKAESDNIDEAETYLLSYYNAETVSWQLSQMKHVKAFRPRMPLAQKALIDYGEGRYYACVLVVLALLDGLINEIYQKLHPERRGFFAEGVDLEAWDSISAHSKGLKALSNVFRQGRYTTVFEQISIPYRNGIMHGMDLGYDNQMVAAKSWAALFAARDWAIKAEKGLLEPPPPAASKTVIETMGEIIQQIREDGDEKIRLQEWKPRAIKLDQCIMPLVYNPEACKSGSPEQNLADFLSYWKIRNYGFMTKYVSDNNHYSSKPLVIRLKGIYGSKRLHWFKFEEINDTAPAITVIKAELNYEEYGREIEKSMDFRMINKDSTGKSSIHGMPGSNWFIIDWDTM